LGSQFADSRLAEGCFSGFRGDLCWPAFDPNGDRRQAVCLSSAFYAFRKIGEGRRDARRSNERVCDLVTLWRSTVSIALLESNWHMILLAIVLFGLLAFTMFRFDEMFTTPKRARVRVQHTTGTDAGGKPILSDPDGRTWKRRMMRK
jgi:hypothetical protein